MKQGSINNYQLIQQAGKGGQGTVWLARSKLTGNDVALKVITLTPTNRDNALQEISSITSISYPKCIPYLSCYHDSFYDPLTNQIVIEMRYVKGVNVAEYTQPLRTTGNRPLLILTTKLLIKTMLLALQFVHSHGIIHNDIKPSNIVVGLDKVPVLVDFGISCLVQDAINSICAQANNNIVGPCCQTLAGTSIYMPPEITKGVRYPQSDLWSLGATAYEIMSGLNIWNISVSQYNPNDLLREVVNKFNTGVLPNRLVSGDTNLDMVVNGFLIYDPSARMSINEALALL